MKISTDHGYDDDFITTYDQVTKAFSKFRNHASIIMIKNKKKDDQIFSFGPVTYDDVLKTTTTPKKQEKITLGTAKAKVSQLSDIPTKTLKRKSDYFAEYIYKNINQCFSKSIFAIVFEISWHNPCL